jgi:hypothetical protein
MASLPRAPLDFPFSERFSAAEQRTRSGELFLALSGFGLSFLARPCSCSAFSVMGLDCSVTFHSMLHLKSFNFSARFFLSDFYDSFLVPACCVFLMHCSLLSFLFSFRFAFVVVSIHSILSLHFPLFIAIFLGLSFPSSALCLGLFVHFVLHSGFVLCHVPEI